ncbi:hypothetical protein E2320_002369 [Naja naja]|nr:hypothetical protein E2320_002369 [Naja naja]
MTAPPNFPPFRPSAETWTSYINRFKCVMDAANLSDIPSNRKKAYFLSFCGATVFDTATAMLAPQTVKAVSWEELQEVLGNHYAPKPSRIAAAMPSVKEPKRKRICHSSRVRDLRLQRRLLAKADLTLKQGIEEARAAELSSVSAAAIQKSINVPGSKPSTAINYEAAAYEDEYLEEEEERWKQSHFSALLNLSAIEISSDFWSLRVENKMGLSTMKETRFFNHLIASDIICQQLLYYNTVQTTPSPLWRN